jgi:hypothetical protein
VSVKPKHALTVSSLLLRTIGSCSDHCNIPPGKCEKHIMSENAEKLALHGDEAVKQSESQDELFSVTPIKRR